MNNDGSGTFRYLINLSQSSTKIKSILLMDEYDGHKVPTEQKINSDFQELIKKSSNLKGISDAKGNIDFESYICTYQCNFASLNSLNTAFDSLAMHFNPKSSLGQKHFDYNSKTKTFSRYAEPQLSKEYASLSETKKMVLEGATYVCIYRFDTEIDSVLTNNTSISKNQLVSFCKLPVLSLAKNGNVIQQKIKLK